MKWAIISERVRFLSYDRIRNNQAKAEAGDAEAQDRLGDMYRLGSGTEKNYEDQRTKRKTMKGSNVMKHIHKGTSLIIYAYMG